MTRTPERTSLAIVAPFPPPFGGMAVQAEKLCRHLSGEGFQVVRVPANPPFPRPLAGLQRVPGVRTAVRFVIFLASLRLLRGSSVVHIFAASHLYFFAVVAPALVAARLFGVRSVLNYRGGEAGSFFRKWGPLVRLFLPLADVVAVPSLFLREVFAKSCGIHAEILPNLADLEQFRFLDRPELKPVLVVSRQLEPLYNHACILKAFGVVLGRHPLAQLKIVGGGSERERLQQLARSLELSGVEFLGPLDHDKLARVYAQAHIMVNASLIDNFPGSLLEAFMCGLPVVSTAVGGIPLMVQDGVTGLLVPSDDAAALAGGVLRLLEEPGLAGKLARNAHQAAQCHGWEKVRVDLLGLYGVTSRREARRGPDVGALAPDLGSKG